MSWEFGDSSHGGGLTNLETVAIGLPRFWALHAGGKTPTSCLISYYLDKNHAGDPWSFCPDLSQRVNPDK
jgi:hypothetical protein